MLKAVLLDRDGTINIDKGYVCRIEDFEFLPRAIEGMKSLFDHGYLLAVATNQSGIGRGLYTEEDMFNLHTHMHNELIKNGISICGVFYCKHDPAAGCGCRKPGVGMLDAIIRAFSVDVGASYMVGDKETDIEAGRKAGLKAIILGSHSSTAADYSCKDLYDASQLILGVKK